MKRIIVILISIFMIICCYSSVYAKDHILVIRDNNIKEKNIYILLRLDVENKIWKIEQSNALEQYNGLIKFKVLKPGSYALMQTRGFRVPKNYDDYYEDNNKLLDNTIKQSPKTGE